MALFQVSSVSLRRLLLNMPVGSDLTVSQSASVSRLEEGYSVAVLKGGRWQEFIAQTVDEALEILRREGVPVED